MQQLVTGEAVALDLPVAGLPSRFVAKAIDTVLQVAVFLLVSFPLGIVVASSSGALAAALRIVLIVAVVFGYPIVMETITRGRTVGKMVMGLRVVRDDAGPIGFRQAFTRGAFAIVDFLTSWIVSVLTMLLTERSKRVGDLLAGTVVVLERAPKNAPPPAQMPPPLASWATGLDLSRLDEGLAGSVRQFVGRASQMTPAAREQLGGQLVGAVDAVVTPAAPPGTPGWAYLAAVLAERRRRDTPTSYADRPTGQGLGPVHGAQPGPTAAPYIPRPTPVEPYARRDRTVPTPPVPETVGDGGHTGGFTLPS